MDLPVVDKPVSAILINRDNQTVIAKAKEFKGQHAILKAHKKKIEIYQKIKKLRSDSVRLYPDC